MDVEDVDSGRFENVILNQIGLSEHFLVLLTATTARDLGTEGDWVGKELDRALELEKNVIPALVDSTSVNDISPTFARRKELLELNFFRLPHELFDQAIDVLVERFLTQPALQELRIRTAEEHYGAAMEARERQDWAVAEAEFDKAAALQTRPEYFLGRAVAKNRQGRTDEALNDLDAAISLDPFSYELMEAKFDLLQYAGRLEDALSLRRNWRPQARVLAFTLGSRIIEKLDHGDDIVTAVHSIPELRMVFGQLPLYEEISASLENLIEHLRDHVLENVEIVKNRLEAELETWRATDTSRR